MKFRVKYIFKEFGINFIFSFLIILFIFALNGIFQLIDLIIKGSFSFYPLFKFFIFTILVSFQYIIPLSFLCSSMSCFSTLSSDRELNIFAFSGIPFSSLVNPLIIFSIIFTLFLLYFNLFILPTMKYQKRNIVYQLKVKNPLSIIIEKEIIREIPDITIYVEKIYKNLNFKNISIAKRERDSTIFLKAEKGKIFYNKKENKLVFILENGNILNYTSTSINTIDFKNYQFYIDLPKNFQTKKIEPKINEMDLIELKKIKDIDSSIELHKRLIFSITPLIFLLFGSCIGNNLKQKNKIIYIGIGGFIGIIFFELLILGEIIVRRYQIPYFIYFPVIIFAIGIKKLWK